VVRKLLADARRTARAALPDPALGGQRQVELDRLARAPAHRAGKDDNRTSSTRSSSSPTAHPRPADPRHDQAVRAGGRHGGPRRALRRPAPVHREGKKIIITTVQKFPFILDEIGSEHRDRPLRHRHRRGALQPGRKDLGRAVAALSDGGAEDDDETAEDQINRIMEAKKLLPNASYFAFTATPKNKTLEIFGEPVPRDGGR
jgi:hypothetical protein